MSSTVSAMRTVNLLRSPTEGVNADLCSGRHGSW